MPALLLTGSPPRTAGRSHSASPPAPRAGARTSPVPPLALAGGRDPFVPLLGPAGALPQVPPSLPPPPPGTFRVGGHVVRLLDVFTRGGSPFAQVGVNADVFTVAVGQAFDGGFRLVEVDPPCATLRFRSGLFVLCREEVGK